MAARNRSTPFDNCDNCGNDYEFHHDKDALVIYLTTPHCNHVKAVCPHCSQETRIYCEPNVILWILKKCKLSIMLGRSAPPDMLDRMNVEDSSIVFTSETPCELPGWILRQLGDDIRKFEHGEQ